MSVSDFFRHLVDGYLFLDLRNMAELKQKEGENGGGVGYPIMATCVSAMELLGGLLCSKDYHHSRDREYFEHYWNDYLVKTNVRYAPFAKLFWSLVRNGVAHTYMAKALITVTKGKKEHHLVFYDDGAKFNIDCLDFYKDLHASYERHVKPKLANNGTFTAQVEKNIDLMLQESEELCKRVFVDLQQADQQVSIGPSGPTGPTPSGIKPLSTTTTTLIPDDVKEKLAQSFHAHTTSRISGASLAAPVRKKVEQDEPPTTISGMV